MKIRLLILLLVIFTAAIFLLDACKKVEELPLVNTNYKPTYIPFIVPAGWPQPVYDIFKNNPRTEEGFQLGRKLFYDGKLSKDGNFACGSCHQQFASFVTYDHQFSHGFNDAHTVRNAPALVNLAWMKEFHWDGSVNNIEAAPLSPINDINQMAETMGNIMSKLCADTVYRRMFNKAFGDSVINSQRILKALVQFIGSIQSFNSKYDKVKRGETNFSIAEQNGYNIFKAKCSTCHTEPLFSDNNFYNIGLILNATLKDIGRMKVTGNANDSLKFKVPGLRNVEYTYPYMHDGRFFTLSQVIEHYQTGIETNQPTLDPFLKNRLAITNQEKIDLIEFLRALSDKVLTEDKRFAQPL